ncbi:MAG: hypothetical protein ABIO45_08835 [Burkholderiaceae bacterium]
MDRHRLSRIAASVAAAVAAALGMAVLASIALAVLDLYLSGHGLPTLTAPWIDSDSVHLSRADVVMLALSALAALVGGVLVHRAPGRQRQSAE